MISCKDEKLTIHCIGDRISYLKRIGLDLVSTSMDILDEHHKHLDEYQKLLWSSIPKENCWKCLICPDKWANWLLKYKLNHVWLTFCWLWKLSHAQPIWEIHDSGHGRLCNILACKRIGFEGNLVRN